MAHAPINNEQTRRGTLGSYQLGELQIASDDPALQGHLAVAYERGAASGRPRCLCSGPHPELYITKVAGQFLLKRMPGTGAEHDAACPSYDPPAELSGLGQVLGSAISEDPTDGSTTLKLGFALTKIGRKAPVLSEGAESESATTSGARLTLRGLLHFLWEEAGFNRWTPAMAGKRHWGVIRRHLLLALDRKQSKGAPLLEAVFIPEPWEEHRKDEIAQRHRSALLKVASPDRGQRKLLLLVGEVRLLEQGRYGHRMFLKHAPDVEFHLPDDLMKQLQRRFEVELGFWRNQAETRDRTAGHLVAIGTFAVNLTGRPALEELVLMYVNRAWIPVEDAFDMELVEQLLLRGVRFVRSLRYNLPGTKPLACVVMQDTPTRPTALYIVRPGASETFERLLEGITQESRLASWIWRVADGEMPALPEIDRQRRRLPTSSPTLSAGHGAPGLDDEPRAEPEAVGR